MGKLKNIKAIKEMMAGTHRTQTRKSHYYGNTKIEIPDEDIIERFENGKPRIWIETDAVTGARTRVTQNDGFKSKESESGYIIRKLQKELSMPDNCPSCGQNMYGIEKRLNKKFWTTHKECFDCVVKFETKLRNDKDAWSKYQNKKMNENAKSFFNDADADVKGLKKLLTQDLKNIQNADGEIETFKKAMSEEEFNKIVMKEYNLYKKNVLKGFKNGQSDTSKGS